MPAADQAGMLARLRGLLPRRWYPDDAAVLDVALTGPAAMWAWAAEGLAWLRLQTRLRTVSGSFLDAAAADYFGARIRRRPEQGDASFRRRVLAELFRERGTRAGLIRALTDLTGRAPVVFEPANASDTGGWGTAGGMGYGRAGGWGTLALPYQAFVTARRPAMGGIPGVAGWSTGAGAYTAFGRIAPTGGMAWASLPMVRDAVTDQDIAETVAGVIPAGTLAWLRVTP